MSASGAPVRAGLVGSGPWAKRIHAPGLAGHDGVKFTHLWARNADSALALAGKYGLEICPSHAELLDAVDLVSYSVPPAVQASLATAARAAGKAVLLEKPAAHSVTGAQRLEQTARPAAAPAVVNYSRLLDAHMQQWIADHRGRLWARARIVMTNGAILSDNPFARSAWRHQPDAALWDLGPHAFSLLVVLFGPVTAVIARMSDKVVQVSAKHSPGGRSEVLCSVAAGNQESFEFVTRDGERFQLSPAFTSALAFQRALDVLLNGPAGVGDVAASDLRISTHIVEILASAERSLADGLRRPVSPWPAGQLDDALRVRPVRRPGIQLPTG
jgi:predicted dehydrogenase